MHETVLKRVQGEKKKLRKAISARRGHKGRRRLLLFLPALLLPLARQTKLWDEPTNSNEAEAENKNELESQPRKMQKLNKDTNSRNCKLKH